MYSMQTASSCLRKMNWPHRVKTLAAPLSVPSEHLAAGGHDKKLSVTTPKSRRFPNENIPLACLFYPFFGNCARISSRNSLSGQCRRRLTPTYQRLSNARAGFGESLRSIRFLARHRDPGNNIGSIARQESQLKSSGI